MTIYEIRYVYPSYARKEREIAERKRLAEIWSRLWIDTETRNETIKRPDCDVTIEPGLTSGT